jgi:hypothetical protein
VLEIFIKAGKLLIRKWRVWALVMQDLLKSAEIKISIDYRKKRVKPQQRSNTQFDRRAGTKE